MEPDRNRPRVKATALSTGDEAPRLLALLTTAAILTTLLLLTRL
jgi:hypothetical protein